MIPEKPNEVLPDQHIQSMEAGRHRAGKTAGRTFLNPACLLCPVPSVAKNMV
jgi:hypothetical protein